MRTSKRWSLWRHRIGARGAASRHCAVLLAWLVGSVAGGAAVASADAAEPPPAETARTAHAEVDQNGDGFVDREEFYHRMMDTFYLNDVNKDGYLDVVELQKMNEAMVFEPADQNDDGKLTIAEYIDQRFAAFHRVDTDSDGLLSVEEVVIAYETP